VIDDWMDKEITAKGIPIEKRRDFVLQMRDARVDFKTI
jgi:hypothetical protein